MVSGAKLKYTRESPPGGLNNDNVYRRSVTRRDSLFTKRVDGSLAVAVAMVWTR